MEKIYIDDTLSGEELKNWEMKMNEPLKARLLSDSEIEQMKLTKTGKTTSP